MTTQNKALSDKKKTTKKSATWVPPKPGCDWYGNRQLLVMKRPWHGDIILNKLDHREDLRSSEGMKHKEND